MILFLLALIAVVQVAILGVLYLLWKGQPAIVAAVQHSTAVRHVAARARERQADGVGAAALRARLLHRAGDGD